MKTYLLSVFLICLISTSFSQNDTAEFNKLKREYDEYIKNETAAFEKYKEDRDTEFAEFLQKDWENFQLFAAGKPILTPGPVKIPVFDKKNEMVSAKKVPAKKITEIPQQTNSEIQMQMRPIPAPLSPEAKKDYDLLSINFYGAELNFIFHKKMAACKVTSATEPQIANFWTDISESDYYRIVEQMLDYKNTLNLNDFAYMKMAESISASIHDNSNNAKLLTWFLLSKSGYKIKVGYSGSSIHLLIPVVNTIYSYSYFVFENMKYYIFEEETQVKSIYTYKQDYPEANRIMNFNIYKAPVFGNEILTRKLKWEYESKNYSFDIDYSKNLIDFYKDYPQGEIQIFFNAGISRFAKESLDKNLESLISGMGEIDAANFLLNFTQNAFSYKTDDEQFGYEKFFFPEEIFHYAYADCEDRSVFFSFLVNEYLRLPVAALNYPGHIATAVRFSETVPGSYFLIDEQKYVICDPTYINAPVGACMPEFVKSEVSIIRLKNTQVNNSEGSIIWSKMINKGFVRTNYEKDIVKIAEDTWILTGIFDSIQLADGKTITSELGFESLFIATVNEKADILAMDVISGDGLLMPVGIASSDNKVFVSGYFSNNLKVGQTTVNATYNRELFVVVYDMNHEVLWVRNSGIVNDEETSNIFFAVNMDKKGNFISKESISEQSFAEQSPVDVSDPEKITIYVKLDGVMPLLNENNIYKENDSYKFAQLLLDLKSDLISKNYSKNSSGLIAFMKILQSGNISLSGKEVMAAIVSINTTFKEDSPQLFQSLKEINEIVSKNGIINLSLKNPDNFSLTGLKFDKNVSFRVLNYKTGNIEIVVLSGISYKPYIKAYPVNFLKIYKSSDVITIDYDSDNDQKVINIGKDLLK